MEDEDEGEDKDDWGTGKKSVAGPNHVTRSRCPIISVEIGFGFIHGAPLGYYSAGIKHG